MTSASKPLLEVRNLVVQFGETRALTAIHGISFTLDRGETLGLVGESGSGKSVTGLALMGLLRRPGQIAEGEILLDGVNLRELSPRAMANLRGRRLAMVFQNPSATLNPVLRIGTQMIEAIRVHEKVSYRAAEARAVEMLERVGISAAKERMAAYPHQFSGGMRQRIAIATALVNRPALLIADEPTTALDVTIQAQIIAEVQQLCRETGTAVIWITHDLSTASAMADRLAIMYAGRIVEIGQIDPVLADPMHPYTRGLVNSIVSSNPVGAPLRQIGGLPPTVGRLPSGCAFRTRCPSATEGCAAPPPWHARAVEGGALCFHPLREVSHV